MRISEKQIIYIEINEILIILINFSASRSTFGLLVAHFFLSNLKVITKCKSFNYSNSYTITHLLSNWENYKRTYVNLYCSNLACSEVVYWKNIKKIYVDIHSPTEELILC